MKTGYITGALLALMLVLGGPAWAKEVTKGPYILSRTGWAVSSHSHKVFRQDPEDGKDALKDVLSECRTATKEDCKGMTAVSSDMFVVAVYCLGRKRILHRRRSVAARSNKKVRRGSAIKGATNVSVAPVSCGYGCSISLVYDTAYSLYSLFCAIQIRKVRLFEFVVLT